MPTAIRPYKQLSLRKVTNALYPCAVLLSQALCDVSRIGALGLSSFLAHFAYDHIHTALFNCQRTVICGGSYQICRIHYGGSIHITVDNNIPSIGSQQNNAKFAEIRKFLKKISTSTSHQCEPKSNSEIFSPQLVAIEKVLKGQDVWKFLKVFFNTPHLYKGIHKGIYAHKL